MHTFLVICDREGDVAVDFYSRFRIILFSVRIDDRECPGSFIVGLGFEIDVIIFVRPALDGVFRCICFREGQSVGRGDGFLFLIGSETAFFVGVVTFDRNLISRTQIQCRTLFVLADGDTVFLFISALDRDIGDIFDRTVEFGVVEEVGSACGYDDASVRVLQ